MGRSLGWFWDGAAFGAAGRCRAEVVAADGAEAAALPATAAAEAMGGCDRREREQGDEGEMGDGDGPKV